MNNFNPKYDDNKKDGKIYIYGKNIKKNGDNYRKTEAFCDIGKTYTETQYNIEQQAIEFEIKDKVMLYESDAGQIKYWCWLVETENVNTTTGLHICRRTSKGKVYDEQEVTLNPHAISILKKFLDEIKLYQEDGINKIQTTNNNFDRILTNDEFLKIVEKNIDCIDDYYMLIDIKKKRQAIVELEEIVKGKHGNEVSIQKFLKRNLWLFGNEYTTFVEEEKINSKNILDGIPKTFENFIDVIEVKLPEVELFHYDQHHNNYYSSSDLTRAIAQTQNYIFELENMTSNNEYQENNNCKIIKPRGIILIGTKKDLNEKETEYLRILNSSYHNLYIITYQQLLEKAKNILSLSQKNNFDLEKQNSN